MTAPKRIQLRRTKGWRGECWYGNCDCTEYRAQETA